MHSDPIADYIIRIKNGYMARKKHVEVPYSKVKGALTTILVSEGYLAGAKQEGATLKLDLHYVDNRPFFSDVKRISKPGRRVYVNKTKVPSVRQGHGITIVSTPEGLLTDRQARAKGLGGEVMVKIW